ncbi:MAG: DUF3298 domain-containing protein [Brumimicrobium sp.]
MKKIGVIIIGIFLLIGCNSESESTFVEEEIEVKEAIAFNTRTVDTMIVAFPEVTDTIVGKIYYHYPVVAETENRWLDYAIQSVLGFETQLEPKSLEEEVIREFKETYKYMDADMPSVNGYYLFDSVGIHFQNKQIIDIVRTHYSYYGGAHGFHSTFSHLYDLNTKERLYWNDIFVDSVVLKKKLENQFRLDYGLTTKDEVEEILFENDFPMTDNILISEDEVIIIYNVYDIAPYSSGLISISLKYEEIEDNLTESFKSMLGFNYVL